jgi:hypothetical protein
VAMELVLLREEEEEEGSSFAATRTWRARLRKLRSGRPSFSGMYVSVSLQQSARQYLWVFVSMGAMRDSSVSGRIRRLECGDSQRWNIH